MDYATLLSATAASLAAGLAGLNLYISGRREDARWRREVLLGAYESYLGASFEVTRVAKYLGGHRGKDFPLSPEEIERRLHLANETKLDTLTRLRLLADERVIEAAAGVHLSDIEFHQLMLSDPKPDRGQYMSALYRCYERRTGFLLAARKSLKVSGTVAPLDNASHDLRSK